MNNDKICRIVNSMLSQYIEHKLDDKQHEFVKKHLENCPMCRKKYENLKDLINMIKSEFYLQNAKSDEKFEEKEYTFFKNNLNAYLDNELEYEDSIKFKKYIMKTPSARKEVQDIYTMQKLLRSAYERTGEKFNTDMSKIVTFPVNEKLRNLKLSVLTKIAIFLGLVILGLSGFVMYNNFAKSNLKYRKILPVKQKIIVYLSNTQKTHFSNL